MSALVAAAARIGTPHRFKIDFEHLTVMSIDLKDGYYLVLLLDGRANEGLAWRQLDGCKGKLIAEM